MWSPLAFMVQYCILAYFPHLLVINHTMWSAGSSTGHMYVATTNRSNKRAYKHVPCFERLRNGFGMGCHDQGVHPTPHPPQGGYHMFRRLLASTLS